MENQELRVSFGVLYVGVVSLSGQTQLEQLQLQFHSQINASYLINVPPYALKFVLNAPL